MILIPTEVYGSWTLAQRAINGVISWGRKKLRKIYGPIKLNGTWRIRANRQLQEL